MTSDTSRIYVISCVEVEVPVPDSSEIYMMEVAVFEGFRLKEKISSNKLQTLTFPTSPMQSANKAERVHPLLLDKLYKPINALRGRH